MFLILGAAVAGTVPLSVALRAAGDDVSLGVAIAALLVMVLTVAHFLAKYAEALRRGGALTADSDAQPDLRRTALLHMAVLWSMPLVVMAAWPWGPVSMVVAWVAAWFCQLALSHGLIVLGILARRRART
jgi:hypothetical protein